MQPLARILIIMVALAATSAVTAWAADPPSDRVLALYFHRTQRCPTCLKMGSYTEEAILGNFEKQLKEKRVSFHYVDFQDEKNAKLTKAYKITSPALIVVKVVDNKVREYTNLKDIWTKVQQKPEYFQYVRESVAAYLKNE